MAANTHFFDSMLEKYTHGDPKKEFELTNYLSLLSMAFVIASFCIKYGDLGLIHTEFEDDMGLDPADFLISASVLVLFACFFWNSHAENKVKSTEMKHEDDEGEEEYLEASKQKRKTHAEVHQNAMTLRVPLFLCASAFGILASLGAMAALNKVDFGDYDTPCIEIVGCIFYLLGTTVATGAMFYNSPMTHGLLSYMNPNAEGTFMERAGVASHSPKMS